MPVRTRSQKKEKQNKPTTAATKRPLTRSITQSNAPSQSQPRRRTRAAAPKDKRSTALKVKTNAKSIKIADMTPRKRRLSRKESAQHTPPSKRQSRGVESPQHSDSSGSNTPSTMLATDLDILTVTDRPRRQCKSRSTKPKRGRNWADALNSNNENDSSRVNTNARSKGKKSKELSVDPPSKPDPPVVAVTKRKGGRSWIVIGKVRNAMLRIQERLLTTEVQSAKESGLKGRETEHDKILSFLTKALCTRTGSSFYVCGSPGTGKTATLSNIMSKLTQNKEKYNMPSITKVNAMRLQTPQAVYSEIHRNIFGKQNAKGLSPNEAARVLEGCFVGNATSKPTSMRIVIIDEMDGLLGNQQSVLYQLFEWCKRRNSSLILFGIANSIDLTVRFLPRLRAHKVEPELLIFKPYSSTQLFNILQYRLSEVSTANAQDENTDEKDPEESVNLVSTGLTYFDIPSLKLCSQKVAKLYGDMRKCLEVCRSALGILLKRCDELENDDNSDATPAQQFKVGFSEMQSVLRSAFDSPLINVIQDLPNHQRIVVVVGTLLGTAIQIHQRAVAAAAKQAANPSQHNSSNQMKALVPTNTTKTKSTLTFPFHKLTCFYDFMSKNHSLPRTSTNELNAIVDKLITEGIFGVTSKRGVGGGGKSKHVTVLRPETELSLLVFEDDVSIAVENHSYLRKFFETPRFVVPPRFR